MVSAAIIVLGVLVLAGVLLLGDRGRERAAGTVRVGDDSASVAARLGTNPRRCTENNLGHLADAFPANTPRPTVEETLGGLHGRTTTRWVYAKKQRTGACRARRGDTEVGFDREGRVLWAVPVFGTTPIVM
jgi:hypothetical protein